tara:strand:- start:402 stop:611 length:210 start_codon:yes stop_codon:yes gene_type:complete
VYSDANWPNVDTLHYFSNNFSTSRIEEHTTNKLFLKLTDLLRKEANAKTPPLFYIYDDGTLEKKMVIKK